MTKIMTELRTILVLTSVCVCQAGAAQEADSAMQTTRARFKEMYDRIQPAHIYGKVVDLDGQPVEGADVKVGWERATLLIGEADHGTETWVKSDVNGRWQFVIEKPHRAYVEEARKMCYEYSTRFNQDSMSRNLVEQPTALNAPVVTVIRKKGEETFLIVIPAVNRENELISVVSPNSQTNGLDVFMERARRAVAGKYTDLTVLADFEPSNGWWRVTYSATNGTDGVLVGSDFLYEAPKEGYTKVVVLAGPPWPKYLYLRSRTPVIYTRLDLDHDVWEGSVTNRVLQINYKAWINPYGERNLEYDRSLQSNWRVEEELTIEAKAALEKKSLPPKPDIPQRIKAMNEKMEKEKASRSNANGKMK